MQPEVTSATRQRLRVCSHTQCYEPVTRVLYRRRSSASTRFKVHWHGHGCAQCRSESMAASHRIAWPHTGFVTTPLSFPVPPPPPYYYTLAIMHWQTAAVLLPSPPIFPPTLSYTGGAGTGTDSAAFFLHNRRLRRHALLLLLPLPVSVLFITWPSLSPGPR